MSELKRSISIKGHRTSVSLELEFWDALQAIAMRDDKTIPTLISEIDATREKRNLSSAIRVFVLNQNLKAQ